MSRAGRILHSERTKFTSSYYYAKQFIRKFFGKHPKVIGSVENIQSWIGGKNLVFEEKALPFPKYEQVLVMICGLNYLILHDLAVEFKKLFRNNFSKANSKIELICWNSICDVYH